MEENHYYPFGLRIASIGGKASNKLPNRRNFQGENAEDDIETGYTDFSLRTFNPQIGRWIQPDPYDQFMSSPYIGFANLPMLSVDKNGGFWEELKNWVLSGGLIDVTGTGERQWISDDAKKEMEYLEQQGSNPHYTWTGNRLTGFGTIVYNSVYVLPLFNPDDGSYDFNHSDGFMYTRKSQVFEAKQDYFIHDGDKVYAAYLDVEFKITAGLQTGLKLDQLKFDVNIGSFEIFKVSFAEGARSIFDSNDPDNVRMLHGAAFGVGIPGTIVGVGGGFEIEHNFNNQLKIWGTATFGLDFKASIDVITKEMELGIARGGAAVKFGVGLSAEPSFKISQVANGDIDKWIDKHKQQ